MRLTNTLQIFLSALSVMSALPASGQPRGNDPVPSHTGADEIPEFQVCESVLSDGSSLGADRLNPSLLNLTQEFALGYNHPRFKTPDNRNVLYGRDIQDRTKRLLEYQRPLKVQTDPFYFKIKGGLEGVGIEILQDPQGHHAFRFSADQVYENLVNRVLKLRQDWQREGKDIGDLIYPGQVVVSRDEIALAGLFSPVPEGFQVLISRTQLARPQLAELGAKRLILSAPLFSNLMRQGFPIVASSETAWTSFQNEKKSFPDVVFLHDISHVLGLLDAPEYFGVYRAFLNALPADVPYDFEVVSELDGLFMSINERLVDLDPSFYDLPLPDPQQILNLNLPDLRASVLRLFQRVVTKSRLIGGSVRTPGFETLHYHRLYCPFFELLNKMDLMERSTGSSDGMTSDRQVLSVIYSNILELLASGRNLSEQIKTAIESRDLDALHLIRKRWASLCL